MTNETVAASPPAVGSETQSSSPDNESDVRQFVIFVCGSEVFGVDMAPVQEIIRVPEVVRVPLGPDTLLGLANLRGKVLPIISLRRLFGFDERDDDDASRALVIDLGQPLGFVVDRVSSVVAVEPEQIEDVRGLSTTVNTEMLSGLLKNVGGFEMVMVMDFQRLIGLELTEIDQLEVASTASAASLGQESGAATEDADATQDELQLVSFQVAEQEYAIPIEHTQEIVQLPEHIVKVPRTESHVLGLMNLRNRLLPLVSLRCLLELPPRTADEHSRIVVVRLGTVTVGLVMDSVNEVLRVPTSAVEAMPTLLAASGNLQEITEICRLGEGGKRLVSVISIRNLFRHSSIQEALDSLNTMQESDSTERNGKEGQRDDEEQVVVFRLDKEEFGVPIASVQEIVRVPEELTHVPKAPAFVEGVINLRGSVLPVIDQRRRLGLPRVERNDRQRIMVFLLDGVRIGFIVDVVAEVLKIPHAAIEPAPQLSAEQAQLITRVANMQKQKRLIQLLDPTHLIAREQRQELASLADQAEAEPPTA
ncbi:MAG: chemotaxis protein CheW [Lamprobacter sp.]|uniref:chemotaxis protein CheW n=1 Tax=Lamprobacter sp. TaxID=3100796 RepID=UPI002B263E4D|nr:chemotaxis protein CheW [Lamprobacter sp.]MEA3639259.1 chemotaxis protein CheW [Lamprobacter sp.]